MSVCWATICVGVMLTALIQAAGNNDYAIHHSNTAWSNATRCMDTCLLNFQYRVETYDDSVSRLLSAGDVQPNPGPVQCPCGICGKGVRRNQRGIACDGCDKWHHAKCIDMTTAEYIQLSNSTDYWHCRQCVLPQFTDSFFDSSSSSSSPGSEQYEHSYDIFQELDSVRMSCPKNIMISHLNINSVRYKFHELSDLFNRSLVDILFISETKLDQTFKQAPFEVTGFKSFRKDRSAHGGGILAYVRADLPCRRRPDLEPAIIESIVIETTVCDRKWAIVCSYRSPSLSDNIFTNDFTVCMDNLHVHFDNIIVIGDLNYDLTVPTKSNALKSVCDVFDLSSLVKKATCFTKNAPPSLIDVILTNRPTLLCHVTNVACGISDWHNLISVVIKGAAPPPAKRKIKCRTYKNFDEEAFNDAVGVIPFHVAYVFEDINDIYWAHECLLKDVLDEHAPVRERTVRTKQCPFMNSRLRKAAFKKAQLFNKFNKWRTSANWERYRKQRNLTSKLKRQSVRSYFYERCSGGPKSKDFWPTVKPFLSNKGLLKDPVITLCENGKIVSDQSAVSGIMNVFYANVAGDIGSVLAPEDIETHPSVVSICSKFENAQTFDFKPISPESIEILIEKSSVKKPLE